MKCIEGIHYKIKRKNIAHYWQPPRYDGDIIAIECAFCDFAIQKNHVQQPRTSTSGLGRYNRMRGKMVEHLHQQHYGKLMEAA